MLYKKIIHTTKCLLCFAILATVLPARSFSAEDLKVVQQENGLYYTVQNGDTLWDLSEQFFDSPWIWPDLWGKNNQIPNPHLIYPGNRIRIYQKDWMGRFAEKAPEKNLPPIKELPKKQLYYFYSQIDNIGFIRKKPVTPHGSIFKVDDDKMLIGAGDLIFIRQMEGPLTKGSQYTVYRTLGPVKDPKTKNNIGLQHYLTGVVEVIKKEPEFAVARVVHSFRSIKLGDFVKPYVRRPPEIPVTESQKGLWGKIILSEENQKIFGDGHIAFIDKGENDGVTPGQTYSICYREEVDDILLTPVDFGTLLVLHTEPTTSTVIIIDSSKSIYAGAKFYTPEP